MDHYNTNAGEGRRDIPSPSPNDRRGSAFEEFLKDYYFDTEQFLRSIALKDTELYLFCGDMKQNVFFISDNLKEDFGFEKNLIYDFVNRLEQRIYEPDQPAHHEDMESMLREKKEMHSIRYRIYNQDGELVWIHCRGILKWNEDKSSPLFFSGTMTSLKNEVEVDPATGLLNLSFAVNELCQLCQSGANMTVLCIGLRTFEEINRTFGRGTGDAILREIGCRMELEMGEGYRYFRMDGTRFLVVAQGEVDPAAPARQIHEIVAEAYQKYGIHVLYPCAIGVLYAPQDGDTPERLIDNSTAAMQRASALPSLDFVEFSTRISQEQREQGDLCLALNSSIEQNFQGFRIVVQPQVDSGTGEIYGGEVLLRWRHEGRQIPPAAFLPILEQSGLIIPVGKWVLMQALRVCSRVIKSRPDFKLSVNVSYLQVLDLAFLPFIREGLKHWQVPGRNLLIELTESRFDEMPEHLEHFFQQCRKMGISLALDDFGTGYSTLQRLFQYPADLVKLDRGLMQELTSSKEKLDFMISIIYACHRFGKSVCVEGVETAEELELVRQAGCDFIQGFYFYRPLEEEDLYRTLGIDTGSACVKGSGGTQKPGRGCNNPG